MSAWRPSVNSNVAPDESMSIKRIASRLRKDGELHICVLGKAFVECDQLAVGRPSKGGQESVVPDFGRKGPELFVCNPARAARRRRVRRRNRCADRRGTRRAFAALPTMSRRPRQMPSGSSQVAEILASSIDKKNARRSTHLRTNFWRPRDGRGIRRPAPAKS